MLFENEVSGMFETLTKYIFCDLMMFKYFLEGCECSNQSKKAMSVEKFNLKKMCDSVLCNSTTFVKLFVVSLEFQIAHAKLFVNKMENSSKPL